MKLWRFNSRSPQQISETEEIQSLCSEAESNAKALLAPLRKTVEELDKLYTAVQSDPEKSIIVRKLCSDINERIFSIKEMIVASSLALEEATAAVNTQEEDGNRAKNADEEITENNK